MPINYQLGKVYKITSYSGDKVYIGSTALPRLCTRFQSHVQDYKSWQRDNSKGKVRSYELFDEYGHENCQITLLENVPANNKDELRIRERYYIESLNCVNKNIPGRTLKEVNIAYYQSNKEMLAEQHKAYYESHKEVLLEKQKSYRESNRDIINEKARSFYETNKESIQKYKSTKYVCDICGGKYTTTGKSQHFKSKKHLNAVVSASDLLQKDIQEVPPLTV